MRIIALLFAFMLTGCAGDRLTAETKPMTKCETVSALLLNPSATRGQVATAMEMGRNNRCFGTGPPVTNIRNRRAATARCGYAGWIGQHHCRNVKNA
jgi:hypothetical protein